MFGLNKDSFGDSMVFSSAIMCGIRFMALFCYKHINLGEKNQAVYKY